MMIAQRLYEGVDVEGEPVGLITYMRTDSTRLSSDAVAACRDHIRDQYGAEVLPPQPVVYKVKAAAQDAHEAIRPTTLAYPPEKVERFLDRDQFKLYKLVWERFVSCQMKPAVYDRTIFDIEAGRLTLRASGKSWCRLISAATMGTCCCEGQMNTRGSRTNSSRSRG